MCGIAGARDDWLRRRGLQPEHAMRTAVAELAWRGPDGHRSIRCGSWWLGCARLAISRADSGQPVVRRGARFAGVMNGAVTNARELWSKWRPGIERRRSLPNDAWLPLLAVADGHCTGELRGHHAFAVVDAERDEVVIGRDRYREKPLLCLYERGELVAFASTTHALARLGATVDLDNEHVAEWFRQGWHRATTRHSVPRPGSSSPMPPALDAASDAQASTTHATNSRRGAPAGAWTVRETPTPPAAGAWPRRGALADRDLHDELVASVERCIDTRVPVGLSLSGGLDSSCLALALAELGAPVPAYQFCADGTPTRERDAARATAAAAKLPLHEVTAGAELLDMLPRLTQLAGQPLGDPSILAVHAVARRAAEHGVKVMLGGEGADELLLGYRRYRLLARLPRLPGRRLLARLFSGWSMKYSVRALRALAATDAIRSLLAVTPPAFAREVLAPELADAACRRDALPATHSQGNLLHAAQLDDLDNYLPRDLLPKVDIALMAAGIESRCPYLEGDFGVFDGSRADLDKRTLRTAFAGKLPDAVTSLPKLGFGLPLDAWFRGHSPWLDVLLEPGSQQRPHLCPGGIRRAIDVHRSGRADIGHGLYLLLAYELYLRSTGGAAASESAPS